MSAHRFFLLGFGLLLGVLFFGLVEELGRALIELRISIPASIAAFAKIEDNSCLFKA